MCELRESFLDACMVEDKPAVQVIREFIRDYIHKLNNTMGTDADAESGSNVSIGRRTDDQKVRPRR